MARKFIVPLHGAFTIYHSNILFIGCTLPNTRKYNSVLKVSSKNFDLDFDWINQVLGFSKFVFHFIVYFCNRVGHELIRTIRAIWSLALGLITEINFNFDIIGLLLRAVYHYQMT